jgi:protein O-GlcNAc transferase
MENFSQLLFKKGLENFKKNKFDQAEKDFEQLLEIIPDNLNILNNLALIYFKNKKFYKSEIILKKLVGISNKDKNTIEFLILVLKKQDKIEEIKKYISENKKVIDTKYQILEKILIPRILENQEEINFYRNQTIENLKLKKYNKNIKLDIDRQLLDPPLFNYSYDKNDNLDLAKSFIKLFKDIYPQLNQQHELNNNNNEKIKIGFISMFFNNHTIEKLFKGIILNLDQKKFDVNIFHLEKKINPVFLKEENKSNIKNFILPKPFEEKVNFLLKSELDILFYPDIGMSTELYYLTFLKLAKKQVTSWGHPETSGNPSIEYFLSSKLLEVENAQSHYSEKLLLSKYLPMYFYKPKIDSIQNFDISKNNIYSCPQTMMKLHPDFDEILKKILENDKKAIIYFIKDDDEVLSKKIYERLKKKISNNIERIKFKKKLGYKDFIHHCGHSSVLLDPLYFGGGNSFHESMFFGTPTVSMPSKFLRSRVVLGSYKQMNIENPPITKSIDEYVSMAINIANKKSSQLLEQKKYYSNNANKELYENKNSIIEVEKILVDLFR